jgi:hypothetical protein
MFIRFVNHEIDEDSGVSQGLFCAAEKLLDEVKLSHYEHELLMESIDWFGRHLRNPYRHRFDRERRRWAYQSICWFRSTATEHVHHAWQMVAILEERDIFMRMIKTDVPGYIIYEDETQVLAFPYNDLRRRLLKQ